MNSPAPVERLTWSIPPGMPGVNILTAENSRQIWKVFHQTYSICTVMDHGGLSDWKYRGRMHRMYRRTIALMEPGEMHQNTRHTAAASFYVLQINPALVGGLAEEMGLGSAPHFKAAMTEVEPLVGRFAGFHDACRNGAPLLERQSRMTAALETLFRSCGERSARLPAMGNRRAVTLVRDYIVANYAAEISLHELSRLAGLSRFHLLRSFTAQWGISPHALQISLRLERARQLLLQGLRAPEIEVGFADQSHLIRNFKRSFGVTPGAYARQMRPKPGFPNLA